MEVSIRGLCEIIQFEISSNFSVSSNWNEMDFMAVKEKSLEMKRITQCFAVTLRPRSCFLKKKVRIYCGW